MADKRITDLDPIVTVQPSTLLVVVDTPTTTPTNKKASVSQLAAVLTPTIPYPVPSGGTGVTTLPAHGVVVGQAAGNLVATPAGALGVPLVGKGASADPSFIAPAFVTMNVNVPTLTGTAKMCGFGVPITPAVSGKLLIIFTGYLRSSVAPNSISFQIMWGTGTPPAAGAALTGNAIGMETGVVPANAALNMPFALIAFWYGYAIGTPLWFDLLMNLNGGAGTISVYQDAVIHEVL